MVVFVYTIERAEPAVSYGSTGTVNSLPKYR